MRSGVVWVWQVGVAYHVAETLRHGDDGSLDVSEVGAVAGAAAGLLTEVLCEEL